MPLIRICVAQSTGARMSGSVSKAGALRYSAQPDSSRPPQPAKIVRHAGWCFKSGHFRYSDSSRPGTSPSGRALRCGLPHIKSRSEVQNTESGEEHRLGHPDT
jgi:hypothetical protein